jgi:hypothetical protein
MDKLLEILPVESLLLSPLLLIALGYLLKRIATLEANHAATTSKLGKRIDDCHDARVRDQIESRDKVIEIARETNATVGRVTALAADSEREKTR